MPNARLNTWYNKHQITCVLTFKHLLQLLYYHFPSQTIILSTMSEVSDNKPPWYLGWLCHKAQPHIQLVVWYNVVPRLIEYINTYVWTAKQTGKLICLKFEGFSPCQCQKLWSHQEYYWIDNIKKNCFISKLPVKWSERKSCYPVKIWNFP